MKIVPQPHVIPMVSPANGLDVSELAQSMTKCSMSPSVERTMSSPSSRSRLPELPQEKLDESVIKPSSLMSSRGRPLPRFGVVRDCPGCSQRIVSVHEEIPGPKAARWHKKCLACKGCSKILDSGATVHEEEGTGSLKPWCTTCLVSQRPAFFFQFHTNCFYSSKKRKQIRSHKNGARLQHSPVFLQILQLCRSISNNVYRKNKMKMI